MMSQCGEKSWREESGSTLIITATHQIFVTFKLLTISGGWGHLTSPA